MPVPVVIAGVVAAIDVVASVYSAWLIAGVIDEFKREIVAGVKSVLDRDLGPLATEIANQRIAAAGQSLQFTDVTDGESVRLDLDRYVTERVNTKAGTDFPSLRDMTRDEFFDESGKAISERIKSETGIDVDVWPPAEMKQSVADEISRQIEGGVGGLLTDEMLAAVEASLIKRLGLDKDKNGNPVSPEKARKNALAALRQKKWRKLNKMHCKC